MAQQEQVKFDFLCYGCGAEARPSADVTCPVCLEPFAVRALATPPPSMWRTLPKSMWDYFDLLPILERGNIVSLGEGATPLVSAPKLAGRFGLGEVLLKNEMVNPTGSFKDRQVSVGISRAQEIGAETVAVVSSGNVACAASAYAARAGMQAVLLTHGHAAPGKLVQAAAYGGIVVQVDSPSARAVFRLCLDACREFGWYHLSTAGMYEPFNVEGAKTIAYEIYQQTGSSLPDWVVAPVGGGGLLGGIWRGFLDLQRIGLIKELPRLAGVQAKGCAPLCNAIEKSMTFLETLQRPWPNPKTIAGGIADDVLFDGHTALPAIRTTNGCALAVGDPEIIEAEGTLARTEGFLCEPSSAVAVAALPHLPGAGKNTRVCCVLTGSGIKDLDAIRAHVPSPKLIPPSLEELRKAIEE